MFHAGTWRFLERKGKILKKRKKGLNLCHGGGWSSSKVLSVGEGGRKTNSLESCPENHKKSIISSRVVNEGERIESGKKLSAA